MRFLLPFFDENWYKQLTKPPRFFFVLLLVFPALPISLLAQQPKLHILWNTVSPNGQYAIGWSTTDPDAMPDPTDDPNPVSNWIIEAATSNKVCDLPNLHFWSLANEKISPYSVDTVWSEDSRYFLILLNQHWSLHNTTLMVLLADTTIRKAEDLTDHISGAIKKQVSKDYDGSFFVNPWFVGADRFLLVGDAGKRDYDFYFEFAKAGETLKLARSVPTDTDTESSDRALNRAYRKLHGLLSTDEQKALVQEERAWLVKRDAIKSREQRDAFITKRCNELDDRAYKISAQKTE